jgi:hypothetical protein
MHWFLQSRVTEPSVRLIPGLQFSNAATYSDVSTSRDGLLVASLSTSRFLVKRSVKKWMLYLRGQSADGPEPVRLLTVAEK